MPFRPRDAEPTEVFALRAARADNRTSTSVEGKA
jgi:hypothetical protein